MSLRRSVISVSPTRARLAAAVAVGLALSLSACAESGAAATVGDRTISIADLQLVTKEINALGEAGTAGAPQTVILDWLILSDFILEDASQRGVVLSDDDAREILVPPADPPAEEGAEGEGAEEGAEGEGAEPATPTPSPQVTPDFSQPTLRAVRTYISANQIVRSFQQPQDAKEWWTSLMERVNEAGVTVNPRYGTFRTPDFDTAQSLDDVLSVVGPRSANWLGTPGSEGSPGPGEGEPGGDEPGPGEPGAGEPGAGDPGAGDPGAGEPGAGDPGAGDPRAGDVAPNPGE